MMSPTVKLPFASHVEPATPDRVKTATLPSKWLVRRNGRWPPPELSINILLAESVLPAPAPASFGLADSFLPGDAVDLPRMRTYAVSRAMHTVVLSCTRARKQTLSASPLGKAGLH